jgi:hypothetical protein
MIEFIIRSDVLYPSLNTPGVERYMDVKTPSIVLMISKIVDLPEFERARRLTLVRPDFFSLEYQ